MLEPCSVRVPQRQTETRALHGSAPAVRQGQSEIYSRAPQREEPATLKPRALQCTGGLDGQTK